MDCSQTENGWFELKGLLSTGRWEGDIGQEATCVGTAGGAAPYSTNNHLGRCGYLNVFHFDSGSCTIDNLA